MALFIVHKGRQISNEKFSLSKSGFKHILSRYFFRGGGRRYQTVSSNNTSPLVLSTFTLSMSFFFSITITVALFML